MTAGSENYRISMQSKLDALLRSEDESIAFPPGLTNEERAFLHALAPKLGLSTKSRGKDSQRFITVSKPTKDQEATMRVDLCAEAARALEKHFVQFAPTPKELESVLSPKSKALSAEPPRRKPAPYKRLPFDKAPFDAGKRDALGKVRRALPAWAFKDRVVAALRLHDVVLIAGETGCGKSTQVPQFVLDAVLGESPGEYCKVACSQPRRLSAMAVAERVAAERGEVAGGTVGYRVRFEAATSSATRLVFATPGVLLRKLWGDSALEEFSHVILDEVHEEDRDTELLLVMLRQLVLKRAGTTKPLKLVLMSATLASEKVEKWFASSHSQLPRLVIGGSAHPVTTFFLGDVLAQTGYGAKLRQPKASDVASGLKALDYVTRAAVLEKRSAVGSGLKCPACSRTGFASPEELGDHAAECFGAGVSGEDFGEDFLAVDDAAVLADVIYNNYASAPPPDAPARPVSFDDDDDDDDPRSRRLAWQASTSAKGPDAAEETLVRAYQRSVPELTVDVDLVVALLKYITGSAYAKGAVVVFVTGWGEIADVTTEIARDAFLAAKCWVAPLHGSIESSKQRHAFAAPPLGKWKVVVATNVAETSVTIPDVSFVIDCGLEKQMAFDDYLGATVLRTCWISKASCHQRRGRAGRTRPGICFRLYSQRRFESMDAQRKSELLRSNLDALALHSTALAATLSSVAPTNEANLNGNADHFTARTFLAAALNAPQPKAVDAAVRALVSLGALQAGAECITPLGRALAKLPLPPRVGLAALYARLLARPQSQSAKGKPLASGLYLCCAIDAKDPFLTTGDAGAAARAKAERRDFGGKCASDVVALGRAADAFSAARKKGSSSANAFCRDHALSYATVALVDNAAQQLDRELPNLACPAMVMDSDRADGVLAALAVAALYPNVAKKRGGESAWTTRCGARCHLHPSSLLSKSKSEQKSDHKDKDDDSWELVAFQALLERDSGGLRRNSGAAGLALATTSPASALAVLLLCHSTVKREASGDGACVFVLDSGFKFELRDEVFDRVVSLRARLQEALHCLISPQTKPLSPHLQDALNAASMALAAEHLDLAHSRATRPNGHAHAPASPNRRAAQPPFLQKKAGPPGAAARPFGPGAAARPATPSAATKAKSPPRPRPAQQKNVELKQTSERPR
mmetsp:Transcript_9650/g.33920  ORF Transcript_9650/g.33920 Transcript_9650/m.33920 type:complete len:1154 (-) Transcript_9650:29-3490(-)